jgi:hypothetical protein
MTPSSRAVNPIAFTREPNMWLDQPSTVSAEHVPGVWVDAYPW